MENQKQRQAACLRRSLFDQGYIDDQFIHLEELQDDANPNFVEEVVKLFYTDSVRLIRNIELALENGPYDFAKLDNMMYQFKGSSSSIGARRVKRQCCQFQEYCNAKNIEGCKNTFEGVKQEYNTLKTKLETYFQMAREGSHYV
ncbi:PREDICTED: histidine-containing phosphotransfer protein 4-like [Nicotiana attenuata]|uniref:Histidine-containing phosphotransfer protein n=1 Tax=Nicotiana attenuata TaxID=49451 RepID=A0A314KIC2_NICAT|nr:PREDICTED: histidine-containing phosphotransfer protein 4-like [Nicotiana attenuata]OIT29083.1 histidine-containing phosphotransfer protein 5 [Nicotiana attenuata]